MGDKSARFSKVLSDPKFRPIPKKTTKLEIDERFEKMFTGKQFKEKCQDCFALFVWSFP